MMTIWLINWDLETKLKATMRETSPKRVIKKNRAANDQIYSRTLILDYE